jgi:hypothetical protein
MKRQLQLIKTIFKTKEGWLALLLSNLFWSSFWFIPLVFGFLTNDPYYYALAGGIYLFFVQPLIPMWFIAPLTAYFIWKKIYKKKDLV